MPGSELGNREVKGKESQRLMFSEKEQPVQPLKIIPVSKDLDQRYTWNSVISEEEVLHLAWRGQGRLTKEVTFEPGVERQG